MAAKGPDLCYHRGDTGALTLNIKDESDSTAVDLTGYTTFLLTIDPSDAPDDAANNIDSMVGTIQSPETDGVVDFIPSGADEAARRVVSEAYVPGEYFYDVQAIDPSGARATLMSRGKFELLQDTTK